MIDDGSRKLKKGPQRDAAETANELLQLIQNLSRELHPGQSRSDSRTLDSHLDKDWGIDSLGRVELLARIEKRFDFNLPETLFTTAETPRDLLRAIHQATEKHTTWSASNQITKPSLGEAKRVPNSAQTLIEVLDWHVSQHPQRPHIRLYSDTDEGDIITYRQLREEALKIAGGLQNNRLQPGQTVCLMLPTCKDYFYSFFGILFAGGIPVPIYPPVRLSQLEDHLQRQCLILSNCRASILITVPEARRLAQLLKAQLPDLHTVITPQELAAKSYHPQTPTLVAQDTAFLQYTSGSTGNPKGVVLSHANLLANILVDGEAIQVNADDIFVSWLPLYHDMGLIGAWLGSLYFSVHLVIISPLSFLARPQRWLWAMHRYRATLSAAPNFAYELCNTRIEEASLQGLDLSHWRIAFNGAEAVSPVTIERFCQRFAAYGFRSEAMFPVYGLAECSVGVSFPPLHRPAKIDRVQRRALMNTARATPADASDTHALRFVACGYPLPGHQVRIVDPSGRELPERRQGELQFQGPSATSGYYRNPQATGSLFDGQWLNSGDLAYIANGEIYITGRVKDVIIRAGRNIYPHELEQAIGDIDGIRNGRVAVFGSTDPRSGTENLIVLAETRETDTAVLNELRSRISAITTERVWIPPDDVVLAPPDTILKTSSGKIRRNACRKIYERGEVGRKQRALWWQLTRITLSGLLPAAQRIRHYIGSRVYTAYTWFFFYLLATLVFIMVLILPREPWRWWFMRTSSRFLAHISGIRLKVNGLEYLADEGKTCVYIANHSSYLDAYVVVAALPRCFSFMAKAELAQNQLAYLFLRRIHTEFVDRLDKEQGIITTRRATQLAREGRSLMFFPEGTFTRMPGLLAFRMGAFIAAVEAGVPIVPIAIQGTRSILHSDSSLTHRGNITVTIGKPLNPNEIKKNIKTTDPWQVALTLRDEARFHILRHCGEPDLGHEKTPL
jgi:1-acyl-sn-glycerol-3-phosphate acyltransferase